MVGTWSRWLTDLFGIDDNDSPEDANELDSNKTECETSFKAFYLLNALSDLMMLPFEMLVDRSTRKEVCPIFGARIIERVLNNFVPDEFNPDPLPEAIFESLDSEDLAEDVTESISSFPCMATPTIYSPPPAASLTNVIGEVENQTLQRSGSTVLRKSYTSDDELDELDSPMTSIIIDNSRTSAPTASNWMPKSNGGRKVIRRFVTITGADFTGFVRRFLLMESTAASRMSCRRPPLHTCGAAFMEIADKAYTNAQHLNGPLDDRIFALESVAEAIFPPSRFAFDKIDELVHVAEILPGKFDEAINNFPTVIHQIPLVDWVLLLAISCLNFFVSRLTEWGNAQEKEIVMDMNSNERSNESAVVHEESAQKTESQSLDRNEIKDGICPVSVSAHYNNY
ncbi:hypothetical protein GH714_035790 [Hevea brasiliensis]|uniref:Uncharacterized protein n=1 Tax=Hevea brasiliensis TaxID=3981 RepID=A0A6A6NKK8_HEVBR|nr:hypothetical protein GH714_035790 [Hevea brasiliensis]